MGQDLVPRQVRDYALWMECFAQVVQDAGPTLGVSVDEAQDLAAGSIRLRELTQQQVSLASAARAATAQRDSFCQEVRRRTATLARRLKQHPGYSLELGRRLGIEHPQTPLGPADLEGVRPVLRCSAGGDGEVVIQFRKGRLSGILLYSRRGEEEGLTLLAKQLCSPCIDVRMPMQRGVPELRQYQARYFLADQPVGQLSDITRVVVPGGV